jgi:hypothetical protein
MTTSSIDHSDPARLGFLYYQVNDFKTISKIAALEKAGGDVNKIKFYCMDDSWKNYDLSKEPTASWDDLLRIRAWQIRNRYKHVALMYSGGWDSHTMLMTFVKNKIPFEEILIWNRTSYMPDHELQDSYETAKQIIKDYSLNCKIGTFEIPWGHHAEIYKRFGENYIYLPGCPVAFNQTGSVVRHDLLDSFTEIKNKHAPGSAVFLEAHDKPRVNLYQGKWYYFYPDASLYIYFGKGAAEMFYISPDCLDLQLKQAYMSIRYFENLISENNYGPEIVHEIQSFKHPKLYAEWNQHIGRVCQNNYSSIYGLGKHGFISSKRLENVKIENFTKDYVDNIHRIYTGGLNKIKELTNFHPEVEGVPVISSKQHYVRDFQKI